MLKETSSKLPQKANFNLKLLIELPTCAKKAAKSTKESLTKKFKLERFKKKLHLYFSFEKRYGKTDSLSISFPSSGFKIQSTYEKN